MNETPGPTTREAVWQGGGHGRDSRAGPRPHRATAGDGGRLPAPASNEWDNFPWEAVDGAIVPRVLPPPADDPLRAGEAADKPCPSCFGVAGELVWEDEGWGLKHSGEPSGLPVVLILRRGGTSTSASSTTSASQHGRISNRLVRIVEGLDNVARCHVRRGTGARTRTPGSWAGPPGSPA